jgi:hypothetical protein
MRSRLQIIQLLVILIISCLMKGQITDPADLPVDLRRFYLMISSKLNETLYPLNSTVSETDPTLFELLTELQNKSFPVLTIISDSSIPNNTWLSYPAVAQFNQIGVRLINALASRILTPDKVSLEIELAAMKDIIQYLELPRKSIDTSFGDEVQIIVNQILDKVCSFCWSLARLVSRTANIEFDARVIHLVWRSRAIKFSSVRY